MNNLDFVAEFCKITSELNPDDSVYEFWTKNSYFFKCVLREIVAPEFHLARTISVGDVDVDGLLNELTASRHIDPLNAERTKKLIKRFPSNYKGEVEIFFVNQSHNPRIADRSGFCVSILIEYYQTCGLECLTPEMTMVLFKDILSNPMSESDSSDYEEVPDQWVAYGEPVGPRKDQVGHGCNPEGNVNRLFVCDVDINTATWMVFCRRKS
ncbi:hypothetical protein COB55_01300 [Candidatus Wolfebacteria bacterium]|nr:MAG: hypothetical protein COB55_01300 [Candidatus Wolfebacteria bacterium]